MAEGNDDAGQVCELVIGHPTGRPAPKVIWRSEMMAYAPNWSPDGRWIVFNACGRLWRISPKGGEPEEIDSDPIDSINNDHLISPDGRWIYVSCDDGHIYRLPFKGGVPQRLSNERHPSFGFRHYLHGITADGTTLAYVGVELRDGLLESRIFTIPSVGGEDQMLTDGACAVDGCDFSADGKWIWFSSEAAATQPGHMQIYRMRRDGSGLKQVTHDERVKWFPHMAPDGSAVVYLSYPEGTRGHPENHDVIIHVIRPDGTGCRDIDRFNGGQGTINVPSWSPDSKAFAYMRFPMVEAPA